jgi:hypothetical protein
MDRSAMATIPARRPGPMIATRRSAQISELIDREATMMNRAMGLRIAAEGVVLRAAMKATGTAMMTPPSVPSVAMLIVSQSGNQSSPKYSQRGGTMRPPISAACLGASATKNQIVSFVISCQHQTNSATSASHPPQSASRARGER